MAEFCAMNCEAFILNIYCFTGKKMLVAVVQILSVPIISSASLPRNALLQKWKNVQCESQDAEHYSCVRWKPIVALVTCQVSSPLFIVICHCKRFAAAFSERERNDTVL